MINSAKSGIALSKRQRRPRVSLALNPGYSSYARRASRKITVENPSVDRGERREIGRGHAFVDLVHGGVDEAEFHDRAIILDEAGVGCSPGRRKLRLAAGHLRNCTAHHIDERAGLGDKDVSVRWLPRDTEMSALRHRVGARFDQRLERSLSVAVIEPNVESPSRLGRND